MYSTEASLSLENPLKPHPTLGSFDSEGVNFPVPNSSDQSATYTGGTFSDFSADIVFISSDLEDHEVLLHGLAAGVEVHLLDAQQDSIRQITDTLAGRTGVNSIEIFTHGQDGSLDFGSTNLSWQNLSTYRDAIQSWSTAFTQDADILLRGCNVAATKLGKAFVQALSDLTETDIAASDNLTGNSALGGDWHLEYLVGQVETKSALGSNAESTYAHVLETFIVSNTNDAGAGSLRQAILQANALPGEDLITFEGGSFADATPDTITLTSGELSIEDIVVISAPGAGLLTVSGNNSQRVFSIQADVSAAIGGMTIAHGSANEGGGIANFGGSLSAFDTTLSNNNASQAGGAILNTGAMLLDGVNLNNNRANSEGGAIANFGNLDMVLSDVQSNAAQDGGGIFNAAILTIDNSIFSLNAASRFGGAIFNLGSTDVLFSVIQNNSATILGGGVASFGGITSIDDSLIKGNEVLASFGAGGGLFNGGGAVVNIINTAINSNFSAGRGGGFFNDFGSILTLRDNSIVISNIALGGGGGIFNETGGSVYVGGSTIISNLASDLSGNFISEGLNTIGSNAGSTGFPRDNLLGDTITRPIEGFGFGGGAFFGGGGIFGGAATGSIPFPGLLFAF